MPESSPTVRLDVPHRDGCDRQLVAIDHEHLARYRPEVSLVVYRDALGLKHPYAWSRWLALICNDMECPAVALIRCDHIEAIVTEELEARNVQ